MRDIISFMVLVALLMSISIWQLWFSVKAAISASVALACSSIMFALNFFAVSLFCLFSFAYSVEMKVLMFCLWECLTAGKALSLANGKGTGTNDWVIKSLDD